VKWTRLGVGGEWASVPGGQRVCTPSPASFPPLHGPAEYEQAYQCFITALKRSPSFAPAFSDLGVYYLEAANPPDPNRASKCFQKAFELDATQADAARRLAESFAEEREWDLVEVVARRTIEGEGGNEQVTSKHLPVNSWAWKALGVVELVSSLPR
jgi:superkiller protein 3